MAGLPKIPDVFLFIVFAGLFTLFPQIDLRVSDLFYRPESGFILKDQPLLVYFYTQTDELAVFIAFGLGSVVLLTFLPWSRLHRWRKVSLYLFLALILGPGLTVNTLLKDHWGRARPRAVQQFGGHQVFTPALIPTHQCQHNCSFVSGHAAVGFYPASVSLITARRRWFWLILGLICGALIGLGRIMQGAHFLSDVIFSFFCIYFIARLLHTLIFKGWPAIQRSRPDLR